MEGIDESFLQCDEAGCNWMLQIEWENIPVWHNKACPKCGNGVIVTDEDLSSYHAITAIAHLNKAIDPDYKLPRAEIVFDTSVGRST